jgi:hypothetical protein
MIGAVRSSAEAGQEVGGGGFHDQFFANIIESPIFHRSRVAFSRALPAMSANFRHHSCPGAGKNLWIAGREIHPSKVPVQQWSARAGSWLGTIPGPHSESGCAGSPVCRRDCRGRKTRPSAETSEIDFS